MQININLGCPDSAIGNVLRERNGLKWAKVYFRSPRPFQITFPMVKDAHSRGPISFDVKIFICVTNPFGWGILISNFSIERPYYCFSFILVFECIFDRHMSANPRFLT